MYQCLRNRLNTTWRPPKKYKFTKNSTSRKDTINPLSINSKKYSKSEDQKYRTCSTTSVKRPRSKQKLLSRNKSSAVNKNLSFTAARANWIKSFLSHRKKRLSKLRPDVNFTPWKLENQKWMKGFFPLLRNLWRVETEPNFKRSTNSTYKKLKIT